jgi:hypothetical protein
MNSNLQRKGSPEVELGLEVVAQSGNTLSQFILAKLLNLSIQLKIVRKYKTCGACARMYCALVFDIGF